MSRGVPGAVDCLETHPSCLEDCARPIRDEVANRLGVAPDPRAVAGHVIPLRYNRDVQRRRKDRDVPKLSPKSSDPPDVIFMLVRQEDTPGGLPPLTKRRDQRVRRVGAAGVDEEITDAIDADGDVGLARDEPSQVEEEPLERTVLGARTAGSHLSVAEAVLNYREDEVIEPLLEGTPCGTAGRLHEP